LILQFEHRYTHGNVLKQLNNIVILALNHDMNVFLNQF